MPMIDSLRGAARRLLHRTLSRARSGGDGGFILLETIIALSLITVIMGAVGAEYVTGLQVTNHDRLQVAAAEIADTTMDSLRAYDPTDLVAGRSQSAVNAEYSTLAGYSNVAANLNSSASVQAYDKDAASGAGSAATIPTSPPSPQTVGNASYTVWQYLECTGPATSGSCQSTLTTSGSNVVNNIKAIVVVTWAQRGCPANTCAYVTSSIVNADSDLTFDLNQPLPPAPVVKDPGGPLTVAVGDSISQQLTTTSANQGVSPLNWTLNSGALPAPLNLGISSGQITGTVTGATSTAGSTGTVNGTVTAMDAYLRTSPAQAISWNVEPRLTLASPGDLANVTTDSVNVQLSASGGSGSTSNYSYTDPNHTLPAGLSISTTGLITGTPSAPGDNNAPQVYPVVLTVTDAQACSACASGYVRTATTSFNWTINYPPLSISQPGSQTWTANWALAANTAGHGQVQMTASGGDGSSSSSNTGNGKYSWKATGLPTGVNIDPVTGLISGIATATASGTATVTVTDRTASKDTTATSYSKPITFPWSVVNPPNVTAPDDRKNTNTAFVSLQVTSTSPGCPNAPCAYSLMNAPAGLSIDGNGLITGTLNVTGALPQNFSTQVVVTDAAGKPVQSTAFTWTVVAKPGMSGFGASTQQMTVGGSYSIPFSYTCPYLKCTISLGTDVGSQTVPGLGLATAANQAGSPSIQVTNASGTLFYTGTVQSGALANNASSTQWTPQLTIISGDNVQTPSSKPTYTVFPVPTLSQLPAHKSSVTANDSVSVAYSCPSASAATPCTISLTGAVPGTGLSTTQSATGDNSTSTSVTVTAATGYVWIAGTVASTAVTGTGPSQPYTPSMTIAPDSGYKSAADAANWTAYVAPSVTAPSAQRSTVGQTVSLQLSTTCANSPCSYVGANLPAGLSIDANGLISGTVNATAKSSTAAKITVTDNDTAAASSVAFTWNVSPKVGGLSDRLVTVGASYTNSTATPLSYNCPDGSCTIRLSGSVPGLGLTTDGASGDKTSYTSLPVTATSGTVYVSGTVQPGAVPSGSSRPYTLSLTVSDNGTFTSGATTATWTAYVAPTVAASDTRNVAVGATVNQAIAYTCPTAGTVSCVVQLSGSVPGVGLAASPSQAGSNATTSLTVSSAGGNVYLTGTVQSSALGGNASKTWNPTLSITDGGAYTGTPAAGAWTAYPAPTAQVAASTKSTTVGQSDYVAVPWTCPDGACTIKLANPVTGLGLATTSAPASNSATTLDVTGTSGTAYITGTVQSSAVASGSQSATFSSAVTITDGGEYTSGSSTVAWTVYAAPSVTATSARSVYEGNTDSTSYTYSCPRGNCTVSITGTSTLPPGLGVTTNNSLTTQTATSQMVSGASGTVYISGLVANNAVTTGSSKTYAVGLQITDGNVTAATSPASSTWTAYAGKPTIGGLVGGNVNRGTNYYEPLSITCPNATCVLSATVSSSPNWVYVGTVNTTTSTSYTITTTSASPNLYLRPVTGTPTGNSVVTLTLTDGGSSSTTATATITVK